MLGSEPRADADDDADADADADFSWLDTRSTGLVGGRRSSDFDDFFADFDDLRDSTTSSSAARAARSSAASRSSAARRSRRSSSTRAEVLTSPDATKERRSSSVDGTTTLRDLAAPRCPSTVCDGRLRRDSRRTSSGCGRSIRCSRSKGLALRSVGCRVGPEIETSFDGTGVHAPARARAARVGPSSSSWYSSSSAGSHSGGRGRW